MKNIQINIQFEMEDIESNGFQVIETVFEDLREKLKQLGVDNWNPTMIVNEDSKKRVSITEEEYKRLLEADKKLDALECAGVDNWGGYCYAMNEYYGDEEDDEEEEDS